MRKPPEALDDVAMLQRVFQVELGPGGVQFDRNVLVGKVFGMFERQIQEHAEFRFQRQIMPGSYRLSVGGGQPGTGAPSESASFTWARQLLLPR